MARSKRLGKDGEWLPSEGGAMQYGRDGSMLRFPVFRLGALDAILPDVDMIDEGKSIRVRIDLPGIKKEDIKLTVKRDSVQVGAASSSAREEKGRSFYFRERSSLGYFRSIPLPAEVDEHSASARFTDGTLELTLNKRHPGRGESREVRIR